MAKLVFIPGKQDEPKIESSHIKIGASTLPMSLKSIVQDAGSGLENDPILYNNNMELKNGKYYIQDGVIYKCIKDTGQTVNNDLSELVGIYVEIAE